MPWFIYNGTCRPKSGGFLKIFFLFFFLFWGSQKGPRPKLKASATLVWVATHSLKTSAIQQRQQKDADRGAILQQQFPVFRYCSR